jgi:hypothetical protein
MEPTQNISSQPLPEWNKPASTGNSGDGFKKQLLQKLMSNLLNKPGRSMHEMINGVKEAIGAYKNYAKEWDTLNGINPQAGASQGTGSSMGAGSGNSIQKLLQSIQQKKTPVTPPAPATPIVPTTDGSGGPGLPPIGQTQQLPTFPPMNTQATQSGYKTPPPVSSLGIWGY